jgi:transketolase
MNGMALHGGFLPYGGTFLVFSDYMRAGMRLGAIMGLHTIYILSHDSVGVGEDGPTHQPVEHVPSLRLMPGMTVWRPADGMETCVAWKDAIRNSAPSVLVFSRQNLPALAHPPSHIGEAEKGGYVLFDCQGMPEAIVIATGSEVHCAFEAVRRLQAAGRAVRLVSMPCTQRFDAQSDAWREHVLPAAVRARVAVEAASPDGWHKYVGTHGRIVGMNGFGLSAPGEMLFEHFGFSAEAVVAAVAACLA